MGSDDEMKDWIERGASADRMTGEIDMSDERERRVQEVAIRFYGTRDTDQLLRALRAAFDAGVEWERDRWQEAMPAPGEEGMTEDEYEEYMSRGVSPAAWDVSKTVSGSPTAQCFRCQRKTWEPMPPHKCGMPQTDGTRCTGVMVGAAPGEEGGE